MVSVAVSAGSDPPGGHRRRSERQMMSELCGGIDLTDARMIHKADQLHIVYYLRHPAKRLD